jgi:hypothetical protein
MGPPSSHSPHVPFHAKQETNKKRKREEGLDLRTTVDDSVLFGGAFPPNSSSSFLIKKDQVELCFVR